MRSLSVILPLVAGKASRKRAQSARASVASEAKAGKDSKDNKTRRALFMVLSSAHPAADAVGHFNCEALFASQDYRRGLLARFGPAQHEHEVVDVADRSAA